MGLSHSSVVSSLKVNVTQPAQLPTRRTRTGAVRVPFLRAAAEVGQLLGHDAASRSWPGCLAAVVVALFSAAGHGVRHTTRPRLENHACLAFFHASLGVGAPATARLCKGTRVPECASVRTRPPTPR
ncbi:hypothetical protein MTO96_005281 [Rhipicephalus appendiculatus]